MGGHVSLVGIKRMDTASTFPTEQLARQICSHIIGMRPDTLGTPYTEDELNDKLASAEARRQDFKELEKRRKRESLSDEVEDEETDNDHKEVILISISYCINVSLSEDGIF